MSANQAIKQHILTTHETQLLPYLTLMFPTIPCLQGRITFEDSPLVRAARLGRVLVLDEADKAPLEVSKRLM